MVIPAEITRIICSGAGALRLVSYLGAGDLVVGVDSLEIKQQQYDARPYALANPGYKKLPVFGNYRGFDHPEKILELNPPPQVIFKTYSGSGHDPVLLARKTGIPVVTLEYGDLYHYRDRLYAALAVLGRALGREDRARAVRAFFDTQIDRLENRTRDLPEDSRPTCFVGGLAYRGAHGFQSTEPGYPPFYFVHADNIAALPDGKMLSHSIFSKEELLRADPDILFLDLSTLQMGRQSGLNELRTGPVCQSLTAVRQGRVYALLPYNWYTQNFGSILANAWYIGKVLYPDRFSDIDPVRQADWIYSFLLGSPVFDRINSVFHDMAFKPVKLE